MPVPLLLRAGRNGGNAKGEFTMKLRLPILFVLTTIAPCFLRGGDAEAPGGGKMLKANAQMHIVANLEKSIAFYREALGLELDAGPGPLSSSALLVQAVAHAPQARARTASFIIPGSEMKFVLIEFSGIEQKTVRQHLYDPGVVRFSIQVRDIDAAFARVKPHGITVLTSGGGPVFTQLPRNKTRAVMMQDPDGFIFEFVQSDPLPASDVPQSSNIYNARASLVVQDLAQALPFYRGVFGFKAREPGVVSDAVLALEGTPAAYVRSSITNPPGATNFWVLWEFTKIDRKTLETRVQDPGSPALSIQVENLGGFLKALEAAGGKVESAGGEAIALGPANRGVLVRSPDGLLIELVENNL
jgi:catechol 2,3-dioxygenase-like lactoylglutathione lyase family enzyme